MAGFVTLTTVLVKHHWVLVHQRFMFCSASVFDADKTGRWVRADAAMYMYACARIVDFVQIIHTLLH